MPPCSDPGAPASSLALFAVRPPVGPPAINGNNRATFTSGIEWTDPLRHRLPSLTFS